MIIPSYIGYCILKEDDSDVKNTSHVDKSKIPLDKQIQAVAKQLYKTYIDAGQFKYKLKDKIKKMKTAGMSEDDITDAQEMGDDQLAKLELSIDEIELRMVAMAGDNAKLSQMAEVWAGEAKGLAAKKNQEFMQKRADRIEKEAEELQKEKESKKSKKSEKDSNDEEDKKDEK